MQIKLYQWGRKDPFTPSITADQWGQGTEVQIYNANGTAITKGVVSAETISEQFKFEDKVITTINHLIQNPSTHYYKGDGTNHVPIASTEGYNNTDKEGDWWNPTIKTIYDPCPNGYRIPKHGTYGNASNWTISTWTGSVLTAGQIWNSNIDTFFPASGLRSHNSGKFGIVGSVSYHWMSTPSSSSRAWFLRPSSGAVTFPSHGYRSDGMTTRCIKE